MKSLFKSKKILITVIIIIFVICTIFAGIEVSSSMKERSLKQNLKLGEKYLTDLNYEDAIVAFENVIEIEPKNVNAYIGEANAFVALDKSDEAVECLEKGIKEIEENGKVVSDCENLYILASEVYQQNDSVEKALDVLERGYKFTSLELFKDLINKMEELIKELNYQKNVRSGEQYVTIESVLEDNKIKVNDYYEVTGISEISLGKIFEKNTVQDDIKELRLSDNVNLMLTTGYYWYFRNELPQPIGGYNGSDPMKVTMDEFKRYLTYIHQDTYINGMVYFKIIIENGEITEISEEYEP